jgi:hypothetical protein
MIIFAIPENVENWKRIGGIKCVEAECQTDLTGHQIMEMHQCINTMTCELTELKKKIMETDLTEDSFKDNDEKTAFYTGLPKFLVFLQVLKLCETFVQSTSTNCLTRFQELLLVLMRLRLNMTFQDLAYRFGISHSTACRIFDKWIEVLYIRLIFLIMWPTRENLRETMPTVFKQHFGNKVAVVIDCFKVFINKPSSLIARSYYMVQLQAPQYYKILNRNNSSWCHIIYLKSMGRTGK